MAALLLGLTSCDNRPDVTGTWQGTIRQSMPGQTQDMMATYDFGKDGKVTASYMINIAEPLPPTDGIVNAYQVNVSGMASVQGVWKYVDGENDEIMLAFDPTTLDVGIDPDAVEYRDNLLTSQQEPALETLKPTIVEYYKQRILSEMRSAHMNQLLDDVEVKGQLLTFELNNVDYTFRRIDFSN